MAGWLQNPLWQVALLYAITLVLTISLGEPGGMAAMGVMSLFAVVMPLSAALGSSWWLHTLATGVLFVMLFAVLSATPAVDAMGEGALVFMLPLMIFAGAVPLGGLLRLWRWRRGRPAHAPHG